MSETEPEKADTGIWVKCFRVEELEAFMESYVYGTPEWAERFFAWVDAHRPEGEGWSAEKVNVGPVYVDVIWLQRGRL